ncbi:hypothetical protein EC2772a_92c00040 [Escherichia coli]|nr:hypothetical protein EC2772a_92c00040 [Escherichia coli]
MVTTSFRAAGTGDTGQAVEAACQPARKPLAGWRLPEGMRATLARRPLPFPFVMCPECFFLMLCFCGYCSSSSSSFRSSPVYGFPGRPPGGAGCRERSQRSCLRPGGLPYLTQNPGFAATGTVAPPLSRRGLRSRHPGKRPPGCKGQRRFANRASRRCGGSLLIACRVPHTRMSPCRRGLIQPQPAALTVQGK